MPGLNGLEAARKLMSQEKNPVIVFTTAYDQYAIDAFDVEAIAYLLKPFDKEHFQHAISRAIKQSEVKENGRYRKYD